MKYFILILALIFTIDVSEAKPNYTYNVAENTDIASVAQGQATLSLSKIKVTSGFNSNRGHATIKLDNGHSIRFNTPKVSNNDFLKLVNIMF